MNSLQGLRILNTRAAHQAASLTKMLNKHGGIVIEHPLISIEKPSDPSPIIKAIHSIEDYDWLVFTSVNSVQFFFLFLKEEKVDKKRLKHVKIAVVGVKTLAELHNNGLQATIMPKQFDGDHLSKKLRNIIQKEERVLFPKSSLARNIIKETLLEENIIIDDPIIYENVLCCKNRNHLNELLRKNKLDLVLFTSPSTVRSFFKQLEEGTKHIVQASIQFAVIGRITAKALVDEGIDQFIAAEKFTMDGLIEAIIKESK